MTWMIDDDELRTSLLLSSGAVPTLQHSAQHVLDRSLQQTSGDVRVLDGGLRTEVEDQRQVQRIRVDHECFLEDTVTSDLLKPDAEKQ